MLTAVITSCIAMHRSILLLSLTTLFVSRYSRDSSFICCNRNDEQARSKAVTRFENVDGFLTIRRYAAATVGSFCEPRPRLV